ncbi:MAG: hypothetical protein AB1374_05875 [Bacillota bacterium]
MPEGEEPCDRCGAGGCYAYAGYGPACRSVNCDWWCGEGVCLLAIDHEIARECGMPAAEVICPFECP